MGITRARTTAGIKLTFSLDLDRPVSVVGDFNQWDPAAHPLKPRTNGKRSAVVTLPPGTRYVFRYLADGGHFFDDPEADGYEDNGYGGTHGVIELDIPARSAAAKPAAAKPAAAKPARKRKG
jgi:1,4-alpha-glucan branching enzyme